MPVRRIVARLTGTPMTISKVHRIISDAWPRR